MRFTGVPSIASTTFQPPNGVVNAELQRQSVDLPVENVVCDQQFMHIAVRCNNQLVSWASMR